ncbi:MAG: IS66 family insertion sequence element accessory protein TnpB [Acidimicrobiia bacterium]|nr:IS66 family insertion sequence element accessory protein TnpB [Acidimicrobiia bacterium]
MAAKRHRRPPPRPLVLYSIERSGRASARTTRECRDARAATTWLHRTLTSRRPACACPGGLCGRRPGPSSGGSRRGGVILTLPASVRIYVAADAVDLRRGFDGLAAATRSLIGDPMSGHLFCFLNRRKNRIKLLVWDRTGYLP